MQWVVDYLKANGGDVLYSQMWKDAPFEHRGQLFPAIERLRSGEKSWWWNGLNAATGKIEHRVKLPAGF